MLRMMKAAALILTLAATTIYGCTPTGLINRGEALFTAETFRGNGRTCATCHLPAENFAIGPKTIRALPPDSPLFVAVPGLEDQAKLLADGLIFVNDVDDDIVEFRPVPKLVQLRKLCSRKGDCKTLGQRGDREKNLCTFSNEAIANHFTKMVPGVPDIDFRLMTAAECKAMTAFLVSKRVAGSRP